MSDIFKILCQDIITEKRFGICDDKPHQRAYIDSNDGAKWMAIVHNDKMQKVTFTALDNCIEIRTPNGRMEKRCEGIITYNNTIIFLEIKDRTGDAKTWAQDADKQLRSTIISIESKIDLDDDFPIKKAVIANRLHKGSIQKHSVRIKQFFEQTGYILMVSNRLIIE